MLRRQVRRYSSEPGHNEKDPASERFRSYLESTSVLWSYAFFLCLGTGAMYYLSLPATTPKMQPTVPWSMETAQTSVPDEYDQPATPQHTRQELERQECLNKYRFHLFHDVQDRCEHFCTRSSVPCPLIQEVHAIYAREIGKDTKSLMNSKSGQNETRTTREELQRLAQLGEERWSIFHGLKRRCEDLCSDSPRPCSIWQEVQRIHKREMDAQEAEGGKSGLLRSMLELDRRFADEREDQ